MSIIKTGKVLYDNIWGHIKLSEWAIKLIDSELFQRLRELHQLGSCFLVFSSATHTRFEHSVGCYHVAKVMAENLRKNSDPNEIKTALLKIPELTKFNGILTDELIELIALAAMGHDLGHGILSHCWDLFMSYFKIDSPYKEHEYRSGVFMEYLIKFKKLPIDDNCIKFIKDLINPNKNQIGFIYQIVSNNFNAVDIDKIDYLRRDAYALNVKIGFDYQWVLQEPQVINDIIAYPKQTVHELRSLFVTRYRLHKQYYNHKVVISTQYLFCDILMLLNKTLKISDSIYDPKQFCKMTDNSIMSYLTFVKSDDPDVIKAKKLLWRLKTRKFYKHVGTLVGDKKFDISVKDFMVPGIEENDVIVHASTIGYVSGKKKNPINSLYFYDQSKQKKTCFKMDIHELTTHPESYREHVLMVFSRDPKKRKLLVDTFHKITEKYKT
jgi:HD superfamily phosphohydrolase